MVRITITLLGLLLSLLHGFGQQFSIDSTKLYEKRTLTLEEANIVTSLYHQTGVHSAVTGGIGSEKLTDFANVIDLKLSKTVSPGIKHSYIAEMGVDYYSSASSDQIDYRVSSASSQDVRFYPSVQFKRENGLTGKTIGGNLAFSKEYDYTSFGFGGQFVKLSASKNTEWGIRTNVFLDSYLKFLPTEFRTGLPGRQDRKGQAGSSARNTFDVSIHLAQVLSKRMHVAITSDISYQQGFLSTPFHRVYLSDGSLKLETLPGQRLKLPVSLRGAFFVGEKVVLRPYYRYYMDSWGILSHTFQMEMPIKVSNSFSLAPFYRGYVQKGTKYFAPYKETEASASFFTSDYDLSTFQSHFFGLGIRHTPFKHLLSMFSISEVELRSGYYMRSDGMNAWIVTLHVQFRQL